MKRIMFRDMALPGVVLCVSCAFAGCGSSVTGTYADASGSFGLDVKSGGQATITYMGAADPCTYTSTGKQLTLNCQGQAGNAVFTINDDGSLTGPPDSAIPQLKKTK